MTSVGTQKLDLPAIYQVLDSRDKSLDPTQYLYKLSGSNFDYVSKHVANSSLRNAIFFSKRHLGLSIFVGPSYLFIVTSKFGIWAYLCYFLWLLILVGSAMQYIADRARAYAVKFSDLAYGFSGIISFDDIRNPRSLEFCSGSLFSLKDSAVPLPIISLFLRSPPFQVYEPIVPGLTIQVPVLQSGGTGTYEGQKNQTVDMDLTDPFNIPVLLAKARKSLPLISPAPAVVLPAPQTAIISDTMVRESQKGQGFVSRRFCGRITRHGSCSSTARVMRTGEGTTNASPVYFIGSSLLSQGGAI